MPWSTRNTRMPRPEEVLRGRDRRIHVAARHFVLGTPMEPPFPGMETALFAMGCFWGAERRFWQASGVHSSAVGYAAGYTRNPTYEAGLHQFHHTHIFRPITSQPAQKCQETE